MPLYRNPGGDNWRYWYVLWYLTAKGSLQRRTWRPYPEARAFACALGLRNCREWWAWCRTGVRPYDIPAKPERVYAATGWAGWGDWLGTGRAIRHRQIQYLADLDQEFGPLTKVEIDAARRLWHGEP